MSERKCSDCQYWSTPSANYQRWADDGHPDNAVGDCHRHAPRPYDSGPGYETMQLLVAILASSPTPAPYNGDWDEAGFIATWPGTAAFEWCGDFRPKEKLLLERSIDSLKLSTRADNCLKNAGCRTVGDLMKYTAQELIRLENFGRRSLAEVRVVLGKLSLSIRDDPFPDDAMKLGGIIQDIQ